MKQTEGTGLYSCRKDVQVAAIAIIQKGFAIPMGIAMGIPMGIAMDIPMSIPMAITWVYPWA